MTIDDDNSIYVGGLPYEATEADLRRAFSLYGSVVAVKIINDREIGGKCYGFVTFTNPRSAVDAISDMNGRTIGGRVVRVNDVRPRGARPNFQHEFHHDVGRDAEWDRERDRDREYARDRERYKDRNFERSRDRDREKERDYDHERDFDRTRDQPVDRNRDRDGQGHAHERDQHWGRTNESDYDHDKEVDEDHDANKDKEYQSKRKFRSHSDDRHSRELSSDSSEKHHNPVIEQLEMSIHRRDELQRELDHLEDKIEEEEQLVVDLHKKSQKLEEAVTAAKKLSSQRQSILAKLHKSFLQVQDYAERLKTSEKELRVLVDNAFSDANVGGDSGGRDGSTYMNVQI